MKLTLQSWYLARSLGVTKHPPEKGIDWIEVKIEGGPMLFWPIVPELRKAKA